MRALLTLAVCLALAPAAQAQDASLFQDLGGKPGIERLMQDFVPRLKADARIGEFFKDTNLKHLQTQLSEQICQLSGGPCKYDGPDMKTTHADMGVGKRDFNALVEDLQLTMDAQGIPFSTQNRLLARLAPMHRDVVSKP
jgi:hemoglobin